YVPAAGVHLSPGLPLDPDELAPLLDAPELLAPDELLEAPDEPLDAPEEPLEAPELDPLLEPLDEPLPVEDDEHAITSPTIENAPAAITPRRASFIRKPPRWSYAFRAVNFPTRARRGGTVYAARMRLLSALAACLALACSSSGKDAPPAPPGPLDDTAAAA